MTPYLEARLLTRDPRRLAVVFVAALLLVIPFGTFLPGSSAGTGTRILALLAMAVLAPLLGIAIGRPQELLTVDADAGEITRRTTGHLPDPRAKTERWPLSSVQLAELEELGTPHHPLWGVVIRLAGGETLHLKPYADVDLAQDTLDHLVLLGLPGASRAAEREASYAQTPPETWL